MSYTTTMTTPTGVAKPHVYIPPSPRDCRSPCPALNAMANHGYLPHDGRDISFMQAVRAMKEVYNVSYPLGIFLTLGGMFLCGQWWRLPWRFDLHELAKHNKIEHDGSLCHEDAGPNHPYAPVRVDHTLLDRLLNVTDDDSFSILDFAQARIHRALQNRKPLDAVHREIAHGEASLTMCIFGKDPKVVNEATAIYPKVVSRSFIEQWFGQDKLPDGWYKPEQEVGFVETVRVSKLLASQIGLRDWIARAA